VIFDNRIVGGMMATRYFISDFSARFSLRLRASAVKN